MAIFEFINCDKVTFFSESYQRDVENYTDLVLDFLLFDRHEYEHTESSSLQFWSVYS